MPSEAPNRAPCVFPTLFSSIESSVPSGEVLSEVPTVRPSEWPSIIPSVMPVSNPSGIQIVLVCGDPTKCPTSDSIQNSIRNSNSITNNEHNVNIRGSPSEIPCVVPTNIPSGDSIEYPAAGQAAKCDEGLIDEPNATLSVDPSTYPASKAVINSNIKSIQLFCMMPTVMPSMFHLFILPSIQSQSIIQVLRVGGAYIGTISLRSMSHGSNVLFVWGAFYLRCEQCR